MVKKIFVNKLISNSLCSVVIVLFISACTSSDGKIADLKYSIKDFHPRIYLTQDRIEDVRKRCADKKSAQGHYYAVLKQFADNYSPGKVENSSYYCLCLAFLYVVGEVPGFDYSKRGVAEYGKLGADMLVKIRPPEDLDYFKRYTPDLIACYDWLFPVLTPDQRAIVFRNFSSVADNMREQLKKSTGGQFRDTREMYAFYGLAFYGDGKYLYPEDRAAAVAVDRKAREYADFFASHFRDQQLVILESTSKGGAYSSGTLYGETPYPGILWALDAWDTASTDDLYKNTSALNGYPFFWLYQMIPYRTHVRYDNANGRTDQPGGLVRFGDYRYIGYTAVAGPFINIAQAQGVAHRQGKEDLAAVFNWLTQYRDDFKVKPFGGPFSVDKWVGAGPLLVWDIIFRDGRVQAKSPREAGLPLAYHFGTTDTGPPLQPDFSNGRPEGAGIVVMRSSWDDPTSTLLWFKASSHFLIHGHRDNGSFQVYKKGWLAIDSGQYEETPHLGNYAQRTVAHNSLLVYRPGEELNKEKTNPVWVGYANDGGQRWSPPVLKQADIRDTEHFLGGVAIFESIPGIYDYTHADITRSYNSVGITSANHEPKISLATRSLLFLRPDEYIVVFDRVTSTKAEYPKRWLLHSIYRPEVDGTEIFDGVIPNSTKIPGRTGGIRLTGNKQGGISESRNTFMFTIRGWDFGPSDGRLVVRTLLPEKSIHRIVGGVDKEGEKKATLSKAYTGGDTIYVRDADGFQPGDFIYIGVTDKPYSYGAYGSPSWPVDDVQYVGWGSIKSVDRKTGSINLRPYGHSIPNYPEGTIVARSGHANARSFEFMDAEYYQWPMYGETVANAGPFHMQHGAWRVEVEPAENNTEDVFLHVMLPCDKDTLSQSQGLLKEKVKMTRSGKNIILDISGRLRTYKITFRGNSQDAYVTVMEREKTIADNELSRSAIKSRKGK